MKIRKEVLYGLIGVLTIVEFYWQPIFGVYNIVKLGLGLSLLTLTIYILWNQIRKKLVIIASLFAFMIGIISTQISILKYEILNSPYKGYLTIKTCHNATKLAERDFNTGKLKYFLLSDFKDTILLQTLENKNIQVVDLGDLGFSHLECNNSITTLSLSQYSPVQ